MGVLITLNVNILKKLIRLIKDKERSMESGIHIIGINLLLFNFNKFSKALTCP